MSLFWQYFINLIKSYEKGDMESYPDPDDPADIGSPLTQDEIDFVKRLKKEMEERYIST
jgi:hypothetical protein